MQICSSYGAFTTLAVKLCFRRFVGPVVLYEELAQGWGQNNLYSRVVAKMLLLSYVGSCIRHNLALSIERPHAPCGRDGTH
jgi:hypothetical protein